MHSDEQLVLFVLPRDNNDTAIHHRSHRSYIVAPGAVLVAWSHLRIGIGYQRFHHRVIVSDDLPVIGHDGVAHQGGGEEGHGGRQKAPDNIQSLAHLGIFGRCRRYLLLGDLLQKFAKVTLES